MFHETGLPDVRLGSPYLGMPSTAVAARTAPAYRAFAVTVARKQQLSPCFVRLTFTGAELADFGRDCLDQRIKIVLPAADGSAPDPAAFAREDWYQEWRALPEDQRNPFRTYTVRAVRTAADGSTELDVDFVLHGDGPDAGPASRWVAQVQPGAASVINGPNARYEGAPVGLEWAPPATATEYLLAGDETAAPAISSIVESLPAGTRADAFIEVPTAADALDIVVPDGVTVTWLPRDGGSGEVAPHGSLLDAAVRRCMDARQRHCASCLGEHTCGLAQALGAPDFVEVDVDDAILWDVPSAVPSVSAAITGCYAWIAGEAATVRDLRRHLVRDIGIDRRAVAFMGYWRRGRSEC